jgi:hypothetical protein
MAEGEDLKLKGCAASEGSPEGHEQGYEYTGGRESMKKGQLPLYQSDRNFREPQSKVGLNLRFILMNEI